MNLLFILFIVVCVVIAISIVFLIRLLHQRRQFGILNSKRVYEDSETRPGQTLYSETLPLCGKPDYLIEQGDTILPVEVKTGKTPHRPYLNHTMQLMAYCFLVEEVYGKRPPGGILKYPDHEFDIAYTDEAKRSLQTVISEVLQLKRTNNEQYCQHPEHNQ